MAEAQGLGGSADSQSKQQHLQTPEAFDKEEGFEQFVVIERFLKTLSLEGNQLEAQRASSRDDNHVMIDFTRNSEENSDSKDFNKRTRISFSPGKGKTSDLNITPIKSGLLRHESEHENLSKPEMVTGQPGPDANQLATNRSKDSRDSNQELISSAIGAMLEFENHMRQIDPVNESIVAELVTPSSSQKSKDKKPQDSGRGLPKSSSETQEAPIFNLAVDARTAELPDARNQREICVEQTESMQNDGSFEVSPNTTQAQNYLPLSTGAKNAAYINMVLSSNFMTSMQQSPETDLRREIKYSDQEKSDDKVLETPILTGRDTQKATQSVKKQEDSPAQVEKQNELGLSMESPSPTKTNYKNHGPEQKSKSSKKFEASDIRSNLDIE